MLDLGLPEISHSFTAVCFVLEDCGRLLILRPHNFTAPNREAIQHASRQGFETARLPRLVTGWQIENRIAVEVIEVGADDCRIFKSYAVVADEIGDATRWIDTVVRTVRATCLCADDFDSARQSLLDNYDSCNARVGRAWGDVELHKRLSDFKTPASMPRPGRFGC